MGQKPLLFFCNSIFAGDWSQINSYQTWGANPKIVPSTDPTGIAWNSDNGRFYIADSEINELPDSVFTGANIFEVSLTGTTVFQEIVSGNTEPTGITYNEADGFFYVSNDGDGGKITRYNATTFAAETTIVTSDDVPAAADAEGITSDPSTGDIYVVNGHLAFMGNPVAPSRLEAPVAILPLVPAPYTYW